MDDVVTFTFPTCPKCGKRLKERITAMGYERYCEEHGIIEQPKQPTEDTPKKQRWYEKMDWTLGVSSFVFALILAALLFAVYLLWDACNNEECIPLNKSHREQIQLLHEINSKLNQILENQKGK